MPSNEKRRPAKAANPKSLADGDKTIIPPIDAVGASTGRRYFARQLIDRATGPAPSYGSIEWIMADEATRIASVVIAAECWATNGDNLEVDLRREIEAAQVAFKVGEDAEYRQRVAEHRERYGSATGGKSFSERRAAQLAAAEPRPGDYLGKRGGTA